MYRLTLIVFLFSHSICYTQNYNPLNRELNYLVQSTIPDSANFHSSIISYSPDYKKDSLGINFKPVLNLKLINEGSSGISYFIQAGVCSYFNFTKTLNLHLNVLTNINKYPSFIYNQIDSNNVLPFLGRSNFKSNKNFFLTQISGSLNYSPRNYITLSLGRNKHFIGDGYRSLFLSDYAAPYSFASLTLQAWRFKYFALWAYLPDIDVTSGSSKFYGKYGAFHYLSINIGNRVNLGFFESVIWWANDTSTHRGFEWAYLNPVIFYRPVEYSMHSPDNSIMGGSLKVRLWKKTFLYGQLFIDDLMVKEVVANRGWYGNKYAIQVGMKCYNFCKIPFLFFQNELNYVRPYVYGHSEGLHNYGVGYQALAHPLGANFEEFLNVIRYSKKNWLFSSLVSITKTGIDSSSVNYGQNIYKTSRSRPGNYGVFLGQGLKQISSLVQLSANYKVIPKWNMYFFTSIYAKNISNGFNAKNDFMFSIGIKTLLYNDEFDW